MHKEYVVRKYTTAVGYLYRYMTVVAYLQINMMLSVRKYTTAIRYLHRYTTAVGYLEINMISSVTAKIHNYTQGMWTQNKKSPKTFIILMTQSI